MRLIGQPRKLSKKNTMVLVSAGSAERSAVAVPWGLSKINFDSMIFCFCGDLFLLANFDMTNLNTKERNVSLQ